MVKSGFMWLKVVYVVLFGLVVLCDYMWLKVV